MTDKQSLPPRRPLRLVAGGFGALVGGAATITGHPIVGGLAAVLLLATALFVAMPVLTACWIAIRTPNGADAVKRIDALNRMIANL